MTIEASKTGEENVNPGEPAGDASKQFSQDQVNKFVADERRKLEAKAKADAQKAAQDAEQAALEKNAEFQKLYEAEKQKVAALEQQVKQLHIQALRAKIGIEVGLPPEISDRLQGDTEEEVRADAEKLKAVLPKQPDGEEDKPAPKGTPSGGKPGSSSKPTGSAEDKKRATELVSAVRGAYGGGL